MTTTGVADRPDVWTEEKRKIKGNLRCKCLQTEKWCHHKLWWLKTTAGTGLDRHHGSSDLAYYVWDSYWASKEKCQGGS